MNTLYLGVQLRHLYGYNHGELETPQVGIKQHKKNMGFDHSYNNPLGDMTGISTQLLINFTKK